MYNYISSIYKGGFGLSEYNIKTVINYPIERVFKVFIDLNKREFPKFNEKNPIGCNNKRTIKYVAKQKIEMVTTVTGYEKNKLYEVTNLINVDTYITKFDFNKIDDNTTEISMTEIQMVKRFTSQLAFLIEKLSAKKKLKDKIVNIKKILEHELERRDGSKDKLEEVNN